MILTEYDQWILWKEREREERTTKVPINAGGRATSITNKKCFRTFDNAYEMWTKNQDLFDGIGFIFTEDDPFVGIDLDAIHRWYGWGEIVKKLNSYTEISPSGKGLHIIVEGHTPGESHGFKMGDHEMGGIEIYDAKRYLTVTLDPIKDHEEVNQNQAGLEWLKATCDDHRPIAHIMKSDYNEKFQSLWTGNWTSVGYASQSEADLAFCRILANNHCPMHQIDRLFRKSKLMRKKWDEKRGKSTYGRDTLILATSEKV